MTAIDEHTTVRLREEIMTTDLKPGEMVMMNIDRGRYYGLESSGHRIWRSLAEPIQVKALIDQLVAAYDGVEREQCAAETITFLTDLEAEGLIDTESAT